MQINLKQPKYILPLILLPFLCLFFFVYHSGAIAKKVDEQPRNRINTSVGQVSGDVQKKLLDDKLDAYRNTYKEGDGMTPINALPSENSTNPTFHSSYSDREKRMLDSINEAMKARYGQHPALPATNIRQPRNTDDQAMINALNGLKNRNSSGNSKGIVDQQVKDPMETFRQQMAYLDSVNKANDPAVKEERQKSEAQARVAAQKAAEPKLTVRLADSPSAEFNTVLPEKHPDLIKVVVDENLTGYAGSRIRLRLLDDIDAGSYRIAKGTYMYALITGFSGQRVELTVKSILYENKILPVKLQVYDLDALSGLYVPESAFRDFTKDFGTNTVQGVTIDGGGTGSVASQFAMSTASKIFESTSSAIAGLIRKDKAKIKYNSYLYLIDNEALEKAQQHY
jgi:conjugative transposon TraM protein